MKGPSASCVFFLKKKYKKEAACHGRTLKHGAHLSCFLLLELTPDVVLIWTSHVVSYIYFKNGRKNLKSNHKSAARVRDNLIWVIFHRCTQKGDRRVEIPTEIWDLNATPAAEKLFANCLQISYWPINSPSSKFHAMVCTDDLGLSRPEPNPALYYSSSIL